METRASWLIKESKIWNRIQRNERGNSIDTYMSQHRNHISYCVFYSTLYLPFRKFADVTIVDLWLEHLLNLSIKFIPSDPRPNW